MASNIAAIPCPPNAQRDQRILAAGATQFLEHPHQQQAARRGNRVTQRDATAIRVGALHEQVQLPNHRQGLGGKRLIQFNHIQVLVRRVLLAIRDASEAPSSKPLARSGLDDSTIS